MSTQGLLPLSHSIAHTKRSHEVSSCASTSLILTPECVPQKRCFQAMEGSTTQPSSPSSRLSTKRNCLETVSSRGESDCEKDGTAEGEIQSSPPPSSEYPSADLRRITLDGEKPGAERPARAIAPSADSTAPSHLSPSSKPQKHRKSSSRTAESRLNSTKGEIAPLNPEEDTAHKKTKANPSKPARPVMLASIEYDLTPEISKSAMSNVRDEFLKQLLEKEIQVRVKGSLQPCTFDQNEATEITNLLFADLVGWNALKRLKKLMRGYSRNTGESVSFATIARADHLASREETPPLFRRYFASVSRAASLARQAEMSNEDTTYFNNIQRLIENVRIHKAYTSIMDALKSDNVAERVEEATQAHVHMRGDIMAYLKAEGYSQSQGVDARSCVRKFMAKQTNLSSPEFKKMNLQAETVAHIVELFGPGVITIFPTDALRKYVDLSYPCRKLTMVGYASWAILRSWLHLICIMRSALLSAIWLSYSNAMCTRLLLLVTALHLTLCSSPVIRHPYSTLSRGRSKTRHDRITRRETAECDGIEVAGKRRKVVTWSTSLPIL